MQKHLRTVTPPEEHTLEELMRCRNLLRGLRRAMEDAETWSDMDLRWLCDAYLGLLDEDPCGGVGFGMCALRYHILGYAKRGELGEVKRNFDAIVNDTENVVIMLWALMEQVSKDTVPDEPPEYDASDAARKQWVTFTFC